MITNFAKRAWDARYDIDPIMRSALGNQDHYKFIMGGFIHQSGYADLPAVFEVRNRTKGVRLVDEIPEIALRAQLDHARTIGQTRTESAWMAGNTFFGVERIFSPSYLRWLNDFRLPGYELTYDETGDYLLRFRGTWAEVSMWEIPALTIISELRARSGLAQLNEFELDALFARAKAKLWDKIERLRRLVELRISDFATRRRHGFLWQDYCVQAMAGALGESFVGTSNPLLAMRHNLEAIGTNAHELPMAYAAILGHDNDELLQQSQYVVLRAWSGLYGENLQIMLPDTFGTTQFLQNAPNEFADWTGIRVDSKDPVTAGEEYIAWVAARGRDPLTKRLMFSDGLDIADIEMLYARFNGRCRLGFGWGTKLANDFEGCGGPPALKPISLVCKLVSIGGYPTVKLSDNAAKAMGPTSEVQRYLQRFGTAGMANVAVTV